jgi:RNase H-fold protein (predicted Holliday junction resolvase)
VFQDERLTSREAESRLAVREKDWRVRKAQLDAAAAAIILQDYLDEHASPPLLPDED